MTMTNSKMVKFVIFFFALVVCSVRCKFVLGNLPGVSINLSFINTSKSISETHVELPVYKDLIVNVTASIKTNQDEKKVDISDVDKNSKQKSKLCQNESDKHLLENYIDSDDIVTLCESSNIDVGTALILTPYIEKGQILEAREASRVKSKIFLGIESYSGFLTVNKTYDSNIFFWYFPIKNQPVGETPWIIWLQGGPGASSMTGLFDEIGPYKIGPTGNLNLNPYTWLQNHSLIFLDNPVGTGYSFTQHVDGFSKDMATYGNNMYQAIYQFLQIFPELKSAPLYVAGESYGGKFVPTLAMEIHNHRNDPGVDINLKGLMVGNPYIEPSMLMNFTHPFYYFGMMNQEQMKLVDSLLKSVQQEITSNNSVEAKYKWSKLIGVILQITHQKHAYNFLQNELLIGRYISFLRKSEVKQAIHVGDIHFSDVNVTVNRIMSEDFLSTAKPLYEQLLEQQYKVLAYCGQLDQMMSCIICSEQYRTWKWNGTSQFLEAYRYPYLFNLKLNGYHKTGGGFTEVMIRGAGHMVPMDEPAPIQDLISHWTHNKPLRKLTTIYNEWLSEDSIKNITIFL